MGSSIARLSDAGAYTHAGPEIGVASTKAFTGQLVVLMMMALKLGHARGTLAIQDYQSLLLELEQVPEKIKEILTDTNQIKLLAEKYKDARDFLFLGRGYNFP